MADQGEGSALDVAPVTATGGTWQRHAAQSHGQAIALPEMIAKGDG